MGEQGIHGTILVVDDDQKVIHFIKNVFSPRGYQVLTASDGESALEVVEKLHSDIDMVLLDLKMPGLDGVEVLKKIKEKYAPMPVGILTAYNEREPECMVNGADFFMAKPYRLRQLHDCIEKIVKKKELPKDEKVEIIPGYVPTAKILIVDDEEQICEALKERLEEGVEISLGEYVVETALDGHEGILKARKFEPDIMIVDIKMPHLRGDEMIVIIEKEGPRPKDYIILSASDSEEDKRQAKRSGFDYVTKPFDDDKFCEDLKLLCFKHKLIKKL